MDDWKDRLKAEYAQTKERYEKLKAWNNKQEVQRHISSEHFTIEDDLSHDLCRRQQKAMGEYLHILELRAEVAGIML